jgi:6-phosphogluconolactonase
MLHVGTNAGNGGAGLHPLCFSADAGWKVRDACPDIRNASFATYSSRHALYYIVDEQKDGAVGAYRATAAGWQQIERVPTGGAEPCYVALNATQDRLAVANYGSGSIAVYRLDDASGVPRDAPEVLRRHSGSGPVADRQDGPHAHCVCFSPDQRWLYHVDLGADAVFAYPFDAETGAVGDSCVAYAAPAGSGPRHLTFHPTLPVAVLASELASTLTLLRIDDGALVATQTVSTLPVNFAGQSIAGHVCINRAGDRVYVTNRGHDSIAVFALELNGSTSLLQHVPSGGASPRAFVLLEDQRQLVLVNEEAGNVAVFSILANGTLAPHHQVLPVPGAVFVFVR